MKLHYKIYGTGKPVIIMHGLFGSGDNWRTIAKNLESDFQCIVVDMRNHGRSPHDPEMNFSVMAEDIYTLMIDLGLHKTSLIGHSMGGKVAMTFALSHPYLVDKLIVVDIAPKKYPPHHTVVIEAIQAIAPEALDDRADAEAILTQYLGDDSSTIQFLMKNLTRLQGEGFAWKANMPVIISSYTSLVDAITYAGTFNGPALFIRGEKSRYIQDEDLTATEALFPHFELKTIPNAGHWVHAEASDSFTRVVKSFLKG
jgi:pimeloyl-ACP methyl ester carboxylesterase